MKQSWTKQSHQILEQATSLDRYNKWIVSLFKSYYGNNLLEIGSGLGGLSQYLTNKNITFSDVRSDYFDFLKKHYGHKTIKLDISKRPSTKLQNSFDSIISSNVFEHIEDDQFAIKNCYLLLKKKGKLLLFVPARNEIYGSLDKAMGHFRRYTKEELELKAKRGGFKIMKIKYVNFPGYFSWWLRGRMPSKLNSDNITSKIIDIFIVPLLYLEKYFSIPFGQSLMMVAEKK